MINAHGWLSSYCWCHERFAVVNYCCSLWIECHINPLPCEVCIIDGTHRKTSSILIEKKKSYIFTWNLSCTKIHSGCNCGNKFWIIYFRENCRVAACHSSRKKIVSKSAILSILAPQSSTERNTRRFACSLSAQSDVLNEKDRRLVLWGKC